MKPNTIIEPTEKHFKYLDKLRESGVTNMYGAAPFLSEDFGITVFAARQILAEWMRTFEARHPR